MRQLLATARWIDIGCRACASLGAWALLVGVIVVAANAVLRKTFGITAPVVFDLQWHFFAATVLFSAAYTLQRDEHVRIDILSQRLGPRGLAWLDLVGFASVLIPLCLAMLWLTLPQFHASFVAGETRATRESVSQLPAWIIKGFLPLGFALLALQGTAEAIRCVAFLRGEIPARRSAASIFQDQFDER